MKKIAMVAYTQLRYDGRVKRAALAAVEAGYKVDIYTLQESTPTQIQGTNVFYCDFFQYKGKSKTRFILSYLRFFWFIAYRITTQHFKNKYQVIHVNNMPNFLVFACIIPKLKGSKIILDVHDLVPEIFAEKFVLPLDHWLIKLLYLEERWSGRFANVLLSTNKLQHKRFVENRINKDSFPIILNASDEDIFRPYYQHNYYDEKLCLIFPSTLAHRLGLDILIEAMSIVVEKQKNVELRIFGDGEYKKELINLISEKNLEEHVKYLGMVDHKILSEEYEKAHVGLIPWPNNHSTNYQMPVKINEYFIKGLAAIVSDVRILKEYFSDHAIFFRAGDDQDFADKILSMARNRNQVEFWAQKGHEFYLQNRWTKYKAKYQQVINQLVD